MPAGGVLFSRLPCTLGAPPVFDSLGIKSTKLKNGTRVVRATAAVPEWKLQAAQVRALRALPEFNKRFTLAGDQNAGRLGIQTAAIAKATGLTSGEHDLRVYLDGGRLGLIE